MPKEIIPSNSRFMNLDIALVMGRFFDLKWEVAGMVYYWLCCNNWINPHMQQTSWIFPDFYGSMISSAAFWSLGITGITGIPGFRRKKDFSASDIGIFFQHDKPRNMALSHSHANIYIYIYGIQHKKSNGVIDVFYGQTPTDTWHYTTLHYHITVQCEAP